jgi:hypothetical protein
MNIMHWRGMIIHLVFILGIIYSGCNSNNQTGRESSEAMNLVDDSGMKQGSWQIYEDTVLVARGSYTDDKPEGLWTYWYKNGQMKEEGHFEAGVKYGIWVEWYQDGQIMWKGEWKNGTRQIEYSGAKPELLFIGPDHSDHVLAADSLYRLKIRVQNIPASNLFVEVSSGVINKIEDSDLFILETSSDSMFTMAIGFMPDLNFMDFRNLVSEMDFKLK